MAINVSLVNFTGQGIRSVKESVQRAKSFREMAKRYGVTVRDTYWTVGAYDLVVITDGPEDALVAVMLNLSKLGNVRTQTMRAMDADGFQRVLDKVT